MRKSRVLIIGDGRIGRAAAHYCKGDSSVAGVDFLTAQKDLRPYDVFIGALPGRLGERCLALALRHKKDLIDVSDVDPPFYLRHKKQIEKCGIRVIPGCGFSPGLVNCILGREAASNPSIRDVEIKAGSLARVAHYFPFLWCFEDLILEHQMDSQQMMGGQKRRCPPFDGYRKEKFFGIPAESYYCASGFENALHKVGARHGICRVVRPDGFREFFLFLRQHGFLSDAHRAFSQRIAEGRTEDNITFAEISLSAGVRRVRWRVKSSCVKGEALNSMQKVTASVPAVIAGWMMAGTLKNRGLFFMEELGRDPEFFSNLIAGLRAKGIQINKWALGLFMVGAVLFSSGCLHLSATVPFQYEPIPILNEGPIPRSVGFNVLADERPRGDRVRTRSVENLPEKVTAKLTEDLRKLRIFGAVHYPATEKDDVIVTGAIRRFSWKAYRGPLAGIPLINLFEATGLPMGLAGGVTEIRLEMKDGKTGVGLGTVSASAHARHVFNMFDVIPEAVGVELSESFQAAEAQLNKKLISRLRESPGGAGSEKES